MSGKKVIEWFRFRNIAVSAVVNTAIDQLSTADESEMYLINDDMDNAKKSIEHSLALIKKYNIMQDAIITAYTLICEIYIRELFSLSPDSNNYKSDKNSTLKKLKSNIFTGGLLALQYPAHRGSIYRSKGWYCYFKGNF